MPVSQGAKAGLWLAAPALLLVGGLLLLPLAVMAGKSLQTFVTAGVEASDLTLANWREVVADGFYLRFLLKTIRIAAMTAAICALLGFIPALMIWSTRFRHKWLLLLLLIAPFWISFTIRTFSWIHILGEKGLVNAALLGWGLRETPLTLLYTEFSVVVGLVHFLLPYMILNIYVALEGIDRSLIAAARSLGCSAPQAFAAVILPLSLPGLGAGLMLCFVLAAGSYVTPQLLGGRSDALFGNLVFDTVMDQLNWPLGAALSLVLIAALGAALAVYARFMGLGRLVQGLSA